MANRLILICFCAWLVVCCTAKVLPSSGDVGSSRDATTLGIQPRKLSAFLAALGIQTVETNGVTYILLPGQISGSGTNGESTMGGGDGGENGGDGGDGPPPDPEMKKKKYG